MTKSWSESLSASEFNPVQKRSLGQWDPLTSMVTILEQKGKMLFNIGTTKNSMKYIYPEEAILLMEKGQLDIISEKKISLEYNCFYILDNQILLNVFKSFVKKFRL